MMQEKTVATEIAYGDNFKSWVIASSILEIKEKFLIIYIFICKHCSLTPGYLGQTLDY